MIVKGLAFNDTRSDVIEAEDRESAMQKASNMYATFDPRVTVVSAREVTDD